MSSMMRRSRELLEAARNFRVGNDVTDGAIRDFLSALDTPRSLAVWLLYKTKEHDQLTALDIDPTWYRTRERFRQDYTATALLSKASFLRTTFDRKEVAMAKFREFETLCALTNRRFANPASDPLNTGPNVWLLNAVKRKIAQVLGDFCAEEFVNEGGWGPGVSTLVKGEEVSAYNKFHDERGITHDLYDLVCPWFAEAYPRWWQHLSRSCSSGVVRFSLEVGNDIVAVPKNAKTDRIIAIEPGINLWFQKAVGRMIKKRLLRVGVNLRSQEVNQRLAKAGSLSGFGLATVDFSSASDSIALELVREVIPPDWFQVMDACRSKLGKADTGLVRWAKFSSMGNGFTFELESLIFYCAASACVEYLQDQAGSQVRLPTDFWVNVFGDDVIIPSHAFNLFSSFSEFLGFRVNRRKSFADGPFRESCGSHYNDGLDCKPVYLKERLRHVEDIYKLANAVRNLAHRHGFTRGCDDRFLDCWRHLYERVPEPLRFKVPASVGDVGFISNFDEARPARARGGFEGYTFRALTTAGLNRRGDGDALILTRLWVQDQLERGNNYTLRGRTRRAVSTLLVARWYNLGPWE